MAGRPFTKLLQAPLADVVAAAGLSPEATQLAAAPASPPPDGFVAQLVEKGQWVDAVRYLAHAMLQREAVWWACLAARAALGSARRPSDVDSVSAAEAWVYKPTEENRRAAMTKAQATKFDTPSAWAAVAAFWSGGSMAPPDVPVVPPPPFLIGRAVAGAVMLAAVTGPADKIEPRYRLLIAQGADIAAGGNGRVAAAG
jgi:hypothetical protein